MRRAARRRLPRVKLRGSYTDRSARRQRVESPPMRTGLMLAALFLVAGCPGGDDGEAPDAPAPPGADAAPPDATPEPACSDGQDNDGDTKYDYPLDPGCVSESDDDETDPAT